MVAVNWVVTHKRAPGSMTVIEAQGMDMTDMRAPSGTQPVEVETVQRRSLKGGHSFPATVAAFTEEDIVARVPGRVSRILAYPGDKVSPGQLLATIDAPEYDAELRKARAMADAKSSEVVSAERMVAHHRNLLEGAKGTVKAAEAAKTRAMTDVEAAELERQKAGDELASKTAEKGERQAEFTYADQELKREQGLYKQGAISLDELQASQRDRDASTAKVQNADATIRSASQSVRIADKRATSARQMAKEADAALTVASAEAGQASEGIGQACRCQCQAVRVQCRSSRRFRRIGASQLPPVARHRRRRGLGTRREPRNRGDDGPGHPAH